jgi:putative tryptophan/tyrosine transport system substrate-binding protein
MKKANWERIFLVGGLIAVLMVNCLMPGCASPSSQSPVATTANSPPAAGPPTGIKIGLTQFASHPAADAGRLGFIAALKDAGYIEGANIVYDFQNPEGDSQKGNTIARHFVDEKVDLIFCFGTSVSQAAVQAARGTNIPVLFCSVTDPISAGLIKDYLHSNENVTGTTDLIDVNRSLEMIRAIVPGLHQLGTLYNAAEPNSLTLNEHLRAAVATAGISLEERRVSAAVEVPMAVHSLMGNVDAVWIGTDNTVVSCLSALLRVTRENRLPFFPSDDASVQAGGIACLGFDEYKIGYQTGRMAVKILAGFPASQIPVESGGDFVYSVNLKAAQVYGVTVPASILEKALNRYEH